MKIIYNDVGLTGTMAASSEAAGYPIDNIRHPFRTKPWKSTGLEDNIVWDFSTPTTITCVSLINHNIVDGSTVKIQGNASDSWTSPSVNETLTYDADIMVKYFVGGAYRFWRLYISQTTSEATYYDGIYTHDGTRTYSPGLIDSYISLGRVMLGTYWQPTKTFNLEWQDGKEDLSSIMGSIDGQDYADVRGQREVINLNISYAPTADKASLKSMFTSTGVHNNVTLTLDDDNPLSTTYYGRFVSSIPITNHVNDRLSYTLQFKEAM